MAAGLRLDPAPLARAQHAEDEQREPRRGEHRADEVELRLRLRRRVGDPAGEDQDRDHDQHLAGEDPAPGEIGREDAADQRPDRNRDRPRGCNHPVRGRAAGDREVPGDERDDRGQDQRRADALEERPAEEQHVEVGCDRGRERAAAVDDAADREGPLAADDRADLRADDHQRRHHQRVGGDRALDPGHRRVDVGGDRRDRHVHDGRVQGHQELARGEGQQDDGRALRGRSGGRRGRSRHATTPAGTSGSGCAGGSSARAWSSRRQPSRSAFTAAAPTSGSSARGSVAG